MYNRQLYIFIPFVQLERCQSDFINSTLHQLSVPEILCGQCTTESPVSHRLCSAFTQKCSAANTWSCLYNYCAEFVGVFWCDVRVSHAYCPTARSPCWPHQGLRVFYVCYVGGEKTLKRWVKIKKKSMKWDFKMVVLIVEWS